MENQNKNLSGHERRLFISLAVIMILLTASFAGAAYAYNAQLITPDQSLESKSLSIDLATHSVQTDVHVQNVQAVNFYDHFAYSGGSRTNEITYALNTMSPFATYDLAVTGDSGFTSISIDVDYVHDIAWGTTHFSDLFDITYQLASADGKATIASTLDPSVFSITSYTGNAPWLFTLSVIITPSGSTTGTAIAAGDNDPLQTAADLTDDFSVDFTLIIEVE